MNAWQEWLVELIAGWRKQAETQNPFGMFPAYHEGLSKGLRQCADELEANLATRLRP